MPDQTDIKQTHVNVGITTGDVTKCWYSMEGAGEPVNIRYIHWAENSSQPMKDSLCFRLYNNDWCSFSLCLVCLPAVLYSRCSVRFIYYVVLLTRYSVRFKCRIVYFIEHFIGFIYLCQVVLITCHSVGFICDVLLSGHSDGFITKTCLYNFDPLKLHFFFFIFIVKQEYTLFFILIFARKHWLWVLVRTASRGRF